MELSESSSSEKQRAREQWSKDPAGAVYGREYEFGTREFFDAVERHRYAEYAPWMPEVMGFKEFAGSQLLEIGCGMGTDLLQCVRGAANVTAIDLTLRSFAYWGEVILRHGILKREFLRGNSPAEIMSKYVEFNEGGGCPLVKVYSRGEARKLFSPCAEVKVQVEQLTRAELYVLGRFIP